MPLNGLETKAIATALVGCDPIFETLLLGRLIEDPPSRDIRES